MGKNKRYSHGTNRKVEITPQGNTIPLLGFEGEWTTMLGDRMCLMIPLDDDPNHNGGPSRYIIVTTGLHPKLMYTVFRGDGNMTSTDDVLMLACMVQEALNGSREVGG